MTGSFTSGNGDQTTTKWFGYNFSFGTLFMCLYRDETDRGKGSSWCSLSNSGITVTGRGYKNQQGNNLVSHTATINVNIKYVSIGK